MTPLMAPDAPTIGTMLDGLMNVWVAAAARPQSR